MLHFNFHPNDVHKRSFLHQEIYHQTKNDPAQSRVVISFEWQGWKDSNFQPTVLETVTLPIELHPYGAGKEIRTLDPRLGKAMLYR